MNYREKYITPKGVKKSGKEKEEMREGKDRAFKRCCQELLDLIKEAYRFEGFTKEELRDEYGYLTKGGPHFIERGAGEAKVISYNKAHLERLVEDGHLRYDVEEEKYYFIDKDSDPFSMALQE